MHRSYFCFFNFLQCVTREIRATEKIGFRNQVRSGLSVLPIHRVKNSVHPHITELLIPQGRDVICL